MQRRNDKDIGRLRAYPRDKKRKEGNYKTFLTPKRNRPLFITHAHVTIRAGYQPIQARIQGPIYSTAPTKDFAEERLIDRKMLEREAREDGMSHSIRQGRPLRSTYGMG
jgi:Cft2 family RNA processing exonuclease